ncbi:MAG TPA: pitrilysin family protein [Polyangiaceae bacterium]
MRHVRSEVSSMLRPSLLASLLVMGLAACGGAPPPPAATPAPAASPAPAPAAAPAPDESFRKTPPPLGPDAVFTPPHIQEKQLPNGVRVRVVELHELPVAAIDLQFDRGADQDKAAIGGFAGAMLLQGTKTRSALQLGDEFERLGATEFAGVDYDSSWLVVNCLAGKLGDALALAADVVQHPAFQKEEIERERSHRLTAIAQQKDRPGTVLSNTVSEVLYPAGHPYASSLLGTEDEVKRATAADFVRFHDEAFRPDRLTVTVAGDVKFDDVVAQVDKALGAWKGKAPKAKTPATPPLPKPGDARVILVDRPGATQSQIALSLVGLPRVNKDFDALTVMNTLLGGAFTSRLNLNLREAHGYTYGARSGFDFRQGPGPFTAGAAVVREKTGPAVTEILKEVERIRTEPVSDQELTDAKAYMIRALPARFETAEQTAGSVANLAVYGLPLDEYATRAARIEKITADDVKRVAATYLNPGAYRLVVVGDAAVVEGQLGQVGMGAVSVKKTKAAEKPEKGKAAEKPEKAKAAEKAKP